ncbi:DNA-binding transcriptional activator of the SARP family [Amycolatopsis marina]|uniref:DNA-binding transcriptional activator of the SARP family n=1 Tax=Amycolatopsis marina TaxID=490629 RepID=A0A1I0ZDH0_9PSEU|nr:BTAD domain-containing putative transcriptional regulator [Amycolatopsis marina]SFB22263.1 DNA-binding transcriptional activator of the SARP family [Amycolatopsis marina]
MTRASVALLGDLEVRVDGQIVPINRQRLRALVNALATRAGRVVTFERLADEIWGEQVPERPRSGLHTLINQLRNLIGADLILTKPGGYLLDLPPDAVDLLRFERLLAAVPCPDLLETRTVLAEALELWRDDTLAPPHLVEHYLAALEQRVDIDLTLGKHSELIAELQQLITSYPLREPLWARLITALYKSERHAEALDTYQRVRSLLSDTLGTDPSPALRELYLRVLAAVDVLPPMPTTGPAVPRQLPPDNSRFTGRSADLALLDKAFQEVATGRSPALIAVHGPGGAGKTTLALRWAHQVSVRFPDGQLYLDMRGYGSDEPLDPASALDILLRAFGVPASQIPSTTAERTALWRTCLYGRQVLLLIDNVRDAGQVRPLLPGVGSVVLVTSRNELRGLAVNNCAWRLNLGELSPHEATSLASEVIGVERCSENSAAVLDLIRLSGRLPLALVTAAEQVTRYPDTPIADLVAEFRSGSGRLDLLGETDDVSLDPRLIFSWSYQALDPVVSQAFRLLGLHPAAEFTVPAASVLLRSSTAGTRRVLDSLVSAHLLEHNQRGKYRFYDLLQAYAVERALEEDSTRKRDAAMRRILDWYLHTLVRARATAFVSSTVEVAPAEDESVQPLDFVNADVATEWYVQQRATLVAVVEYADDNGFNRHGWQLAFLLRDFQEVEQHVDEGTRAAEVAMRCAQRSGDQEALRYATHLIGVA